MVTSPQGVKCVWNVINADKYNFFSLRGLLLYSLHRHWSCGCSQSANFKLKYKSKHSPSTFILSEGPIRDLDVCLTCQLMHFRSSEYQNNSPL